MSIFDLLEEYMVEEENIVTKLINKFKFAIPKTTDAIIKALTNALLNANAGEINAIKNALVSEGVVNESLFGRIRGLFDNVKIASIVVLLLLLVPKTAEAKDLFDKTIDKIESIKQSTVKDVESQKKEIEHFIQQTIPEKTEFATKETKEKAMELGKNLKAKGAAMGDDNTKTFRDFIKSKETKPDTTSKIDLNNPANI